MDVLKIIKLKLFLVQGSLKHQNPDSTLIRSILDEVKKKKKKILIGLRINRALKALNPIITKSEIENLRETNCGKMKSRNLRNNTENIINKEIKILN